MRAENEVIGMDMTPGIAMATTTARRRSSFMVEIGLQYLVEL